MEMKKIFLSVKDAEDAETRRLGDSETRRLANSHISSEMGLFFFTKILMYQMIQFQKGTS